MKPLPMVIAALTLALLGGAIWYSEKHPPKPESDSEAKPAVKMTSIKEADITKLRISHPASPEDAATTLEKDAKGGWTITEPKKLPAEEGSVRSLLQALSGLEAEQVIADKAGDWKTYGLETPKVKVEATLSSGKPLEVLLGNDAPTGSPTYARIPGDDRVFGVSSSVKSSFQKTSAELRDKRLLRVDAEKVTKVVLSNGKNAGDQALEFARNGADWKIVKPHVMRADNYSVEDLIRAGASSYDSIVAEDDNSKEAKAHNFSKPFAVLTAVDPAGEHRLTVIEEKTAAPKPKGKPAAKSDTDTDSAVISFYYVKSSDLTGVYKLTSSSSTALGKAVDGYRNGRLFDLSFTDPEKIELRDGSLQIVIDKKFDKDKKEDQWFKGKTQVTSDKVQSLLSQMRRLTAASYTSDDAAEQAKYGIPRATIEVKVTMAGKTQRAVFAAQGDKFYAARDGDPATYEVAALEVQDLKKFIADLK